ncbi:hypothetical protein ISN44_As09g005190 [Arabidopsis suecica]|uniref:Uncharacterized protein n=1 Tax=Arabidopsis suecica TaxID=45249 RepID=A0A8T2AF64_ARASU|nr:hypothetical protein ISN44_As09g005190 [Arabidopsis suecica]
MLTGTGHPVSLDDASRTKMETQDPSTSCHRRVVLRRKKKNELSFVEEA